MVRVNEHVLDNPLPYAVRVDQHMLIVDTSNATISLLTGTEGLVQYVARIGELFNIFSVHSSTQMPLDMAVQSMNRLMEYLLGILLIMSVRVTTYMG